MPKLDRLTMSFYLTRTDRSNIEDGVFDFGIENLPNLVTLAGRVVVPVNSGFVYEDEAKAIAERTVRAHPNNPTLLFL